MPKTRFNTYDLMCSVREMQQYVGMRVNNIYDIDNKTYLIRLQRTEEKVTLLIESGTRIHTTNFEWPKNVAPSGFSMKMRKHLKNKRLESLTQLGVDRVVDMQFGTDEASYHVILELYDRGNVILADHEMTILYLLRPHTEGDKLRIALREKYPIDRARTENDVSLERLTEIVEAAKNGDQLKKVLLPHYEYGPSIIEHVLFKCGYKNATKIGKDFDRRDVEKLYEAMKEAKVIFDEPTGKGYIIQKREERPDASNLGATDNTFLLTNQEFHPYLYAQHANDPHVVVYETFNRAVDEFYSTLEGQKIELKTLQREREAAKKLENVRNDHVQRLRTLEGVQEIDRQKAELITRNRELVDGAILAIQNAVASQLPWSDINGLVEEARSRGDPMAESIKQLKLEINHVTLTLSDPYCDGDIPTMDVDVDLGLTAFSNGRRYYDQKRSAAKKQQKTIESQCKALKSAERKTKQTLKEMQTIKNIQKARKVYWFEKFFWFVSSENYLIIAGRDQQQNELIVKRYMRPYDVYVHADVHGASSVLIKNPRHQHASTTSSNVDDVTKSRPSIPPKTLNEAGTMAICYSVAWDAKVITNSYWVYGDQVTKTAPTGEYLTTGSFVIRGKKNYLPVSQLILGMSFVFRLDDDSLCRHVDERKVIVDETKEETENVEGVVVETSSSSSSRNNVDDDDVEIPIMDESDENDEESDVTKTRDDRTNVNVANVEGDQVDDGDGAEEDDDDDDLGRFPNTEIKIRHVNDGDGGGGGGKMIDIVTTTSTILNNNVEDLERGGNEAFTTRIGGRHSSGRTKKVKWVGNIGVDDDDDADNRTTNTNRNDDDKKTKTNADISATTTAKRGQKSKLKKIREKYKDQDDEERKLRMDILQSAGQSKKFNNNNNNGMKTKENVTNRGRTKQQQETKNTRNLQQQQRQQQQVEGGKNEADNDEEDTGPQIDVDMLNSLTGIPHVDDELIFAIPVVAPYNALTNYKFKVKLTPGNNRRGKAAKTALNMFLQDRSITNRERDLLKAVKDEQLARNVPGKVKLSAPRLQTFKR